MSKINEKAKVSVIMPSLNVADYIKEALDSACSQTLKDIEILCIDAGSTDGTLEIIETAARTDSRIRLCVSEVRSYGYQVNLGIREATGKYIAVLETDDYVDPDMYRKLYEIAEEYSADYVKADYDAFFTQDDGTYYHFPRHTFSGKEMYDTLICPRDHVNIGRDDWYLWQGIFSKDYILNNDIRFNESFGAAYQDIGFLFWSGAYADRAVYIRDMLYHYRIDRDAASSNSGKGLAYSYAEFQRIIGMLEEEGYESLRNDAVMKLLYCRMAKSFVSCYSGISEKPEDIEARREKYEWFSAQLKKAAEMGYIDKTIVQQGRWERLNALMESEGKYFEKYSDDKRDDGFLAEHNEFVIFGCGDFGFKAYRKIRSLGKSIRAFADNNESLWGKRFNGIAIVPPEDVRNVAEGTGIVIANEAHYDSIKKQLISYGVDPERLFIFQ